MLYKSIKSVHIVLASQAAWRSELLNQVCIEHQQVQHRYAEPEYLDEPLDLFIESIAREKASSLVEDFPESMIIAADQLVCVENTVLYKSGTREDAIDQLEKLNGRTHQLICAVAVSYKGATESAIEKATLKMRDLSREEIVTYVDFDEPWDCAGSYKYESLGAALFERIEVSDPTAIIGLPVNRLLTILRSWGYSSLLR